MVLKHFKSVYIKMSCCEGCSHLYFKGFALFYQNSARPMDFFVLTAFYLLWSSTPRAKETAFTETVREFEGLQGVQPVTPGRRKAPMTNKVTEYIIKDRYG